MSLHSLIDINAGYSRLGGSMTGLSSGMYPSSYPSTEQNPYPSISMENSASAFYGSLVSTSPQHLMYLMYLNQDQGLNWDFPERKLVGIVNLCSFLSYSNLTLHSFPS